jgi:hypothetical protein
MSDDNSNNNENNTNDNNDLPKKKKIRRTNDQIFADEYKKDPDAALKKIANETLKEFNDYKNYVNNTIAMNEAIKKSETIGEEDNEDDEPKRVLGRPFEKGNRGRPPGSTKSNCLDKKLKSKHFDPVINLINIVHDTERDIRANSVSKEVMQARSLLTQINTTLVNKLYSNKKDVSVTSTEDKTVTISFQMPSADAERQQLLNSRFGNPRIIDGNSGEEVKE